MNNNNNLKNQKNQKNTVVVYIVGKYDSQSLRYFGYATIFDNINKKYFNLNDNKKDWFCLKDTAGEVLMLNYVINWGLRNHKNLMIQINDARLIKWCNGDFKTDNSYSKLLRYTFNKAIGKIKIEISKADYSDRIYNGMKKGIKYQILYYNEKHKLINEKNEIKG
jgi:hypothetical protein